MDKSFNQPSLERKS